MSRDDFDDQDPKFIKTRKEQDSPVFDVSEHPDVIDAGHELLAKVDASRSPDETITDITSNNVDIIPEEIQPPATGACCIPLVGCADGLTEAQCDAANGEWQGEGTICAPDTCPDPEPEDPVGACCLPDGSCQETTQALCEQGFEGVWQGEGTLCEDVDCPVPGVCCVGGACVPNEFIADKDTCETQFNGQWIENATCADDPCFIPQVMGACCNRSDGKDCELTTEDFCKLPTVNGTWLGPNTTCEECPEEEEVGACCEPVEDGFECFQRTEQQCSDNGGVWHGADVPCEQVECDLGACCIDGVCDERTQAECEAFGGVWQGPNIPCFSNTCIDECDNESDCTPIQRLTGDDMFWIEPDNDRDFFYPQPCTFKKHEQEKGYMVFHMDSVDAVSPEFLNDFQQFADSLGIVDPRVGANGGPLPVGYSAEIDGGYVHNANNPNPDAILNPETGEFELLKKVNANGWNNRPMWDEMEYTTLVNRIVGRMGLDTYDDWGDVNVNLDMEHGFVGNLLVGVDGNGNQVWEPSPGNVACYYDADNPDSELNARQELIELGHKVNGQFIKLIDMVRRECVSRPGVSRPPKMTLYQAPRCPTHIQTTSDQDITDHGEIDGRPWVGTPRPSTAWKNLDEATKIEVARRSLRNAPYYWQGGFVPKEKYDGIDDGIWTWDLPEEIENEDGVDGHEWPPLDDLSLVSFFFGQMDGGQADPENYINSEGVEEEQVERSVYVAQQCKLLEEERDAQGLDTPGLEIFTALKVTDKKQSAFIGEYVSPCTVDFFMTKNRGVGVDKFLFLEFGLPTIWSSIFKTDADDGWGDYSDNIKAKAVQAWENIIIPITLEGYEFPQNQWVPGMTALEGAQATLEQEGFCSDTELRSQWWQVWNDFLCDRFGQPSSDCLDEECDRYGDVIVEPPDGACCGECDENGDRNCFQSKEADCSGTWLGPETDCDECEPCIQPTLDFDITLTRIGDVDPESGEFRPGEDDIQATININEGNIVGTPTVKWYVTSDHFPRERPNIWNNGDDPIVQKELIMALLKKYSPEWQDYYLFNKIPFRNTATGGVRNESAVPIGLNPNCRAAGWDLTGFAIKPRRFNNRIDNIPGDMPGPNNPLDTLQDLNYYNSGHWSAYAITPRHVVVCWHFIKNTPSPNLINNVNAGQEQQDLGPWPEAANEPNTLVFMNAEGEYFVHSYTFADPPVDGTLPVSSQLGGLPGDSVLLVLDEPIPADSGIRIYNRNAVIDMDQQFAMLLMFDSQSRVRFESYGGFLTPVDRVHVNTPQFNLTRSISPGIPDLVEERKLPGGDLENEPIEYASTGTFHSDTVAQTWSGDSGSPVLVHSKSKGTLPVCGPGGWFTCCQLGPWAKERVDAFQTYLATFNAENGTDYTFGYEVITDAITDVMVPPLINPLVCKTQEGMRSRRLVCEVTATGSNGEVITKRSDSILADTINEPLVLADDPIHTFVSRDVTPDEFENSMETDAIARTSTFPQWIGIDIEELNMDPICKFLNGTVAIRSTTDSNRALFLTVPKDKNRPWQPAQFQTVLGDDTYYHSEQFSLPADWPNDDDVTIQIFLTTQNGTITATKTVDLIDLEAPQLIDAQYFAPGVDPNFPSGKIRMEYSGSPTPEILATAFLRDPNTGENTGVAATVTTAGGDDQDPTFVEFPIKYGFAADPTPIPCDPHFGDSLFLEARLANTAGLYHVGPLAVPPDETPDEPARMLTTIDQNNCAGDNPFIGACCFNTFCVPDQTQDFCEGNGGVWYSATPCDDDLCAEDPDPVGACCLPDGGCTQTTEAECVNSRFGVWHEGETCLNNPCDDDDDTGIGTGQQTLG